MQVTIRPLRPEQLPACAEVIRQGFAGVAREFGLTKENCPSNGAFITEELLRQAVEKGHLFYGLFEDGVLAGCMALEPQDEADVFELGRLAVLPEKRHHGYGKRLIDEARRRAKELGARKIVIGIIEENTRLRQWYTDYGFVHTGTRVFAHLPFTVGFMEIGV